MDWSDLAHFLVLMRTGTLRAAAKELRVAPTTIARRVASLESALSVQLFVRTAAGLSPTDGARELWESARSIEEAMGALGRRLQPPTREIRGPVRVSSTELVISEVLAPSLGALLQRHPALEVTLRVEPQIISFSRNDTEIAVRMKRPEGQRLVARRVARLALGLYATRAYLARPGKRVLQEERLLSYDDTYGRIPELIYLERHGLLGSLALRTSSTRALLAATLAGSGIGLLPAFLAHRYAELVPVTAPPIPLREVYLVTHEDLRRKPAVDAVFRHFAGAFASLV